MTTPPKLKPRTLAPGLAFALRDRSHQGLLWLGWGVGLGLALGLMPHENTTAFHAPTFGFFLLFFGSVAALFKLLRSSDPSGGLTLRWGTWRRSLLPALSTAFGALALTQAVGPQGQRSALLAAFLVPCLGGYLWRKMRDGLWLLPTQRWALFFSCGAALVWLLGESLAGEFPLHHPSLSWALGAGFLFIPLAAGPSRLAWPLSACEAQLSRLWSWLQALLLGVVLLGVCVKWAPTGAFPRVQSPRPSQALEGTLQMGAWAAAIIWAGGWETPLGAQPYRKGRPLWAVGLLLGWAAVGLRQPHGPFFLPGLAVFALWTSASALILLPNPTLPADPFRPSDKPKPSPSDASVPEASMAAMPLPSNVVDFEAALRVKRGA